MSKWKLIDSYWREGLLIHLMRPSDPREPARVLWAIDDPCKADGCFDGVCRTQAEALQEATREAANIRSMMPVDMEETGDEWD